MFWIIWLISFIVVVVIFKTIVNSLMSFIGADLYMFNIVSRTITCGVLSLILAFFIYALIFG